MDRSESAVQGAQQWVAPRLNRLGASGKAANGSSWNFQDSTTPDGEINFGTS